MTLRFSQSMYTELISKISCDVSITDSFRKYVLYAFFVAFHLPKSGKGMSITAKLTPIYLKLSSSKFNCNSISSGYKLEGFKCIKPIKLGANFTLMYCCKTKNVSFNDAAGTQFNLFESCSLSKHTITMGLSDMRGHSLRQVRITRCGYLSSPLAPMYSRPNIDIASK